MEYSAGLFQCGYFCCSFSLEVSLALALNERTRFERVPFCDADTQLVNLLENKFQSLGMKFMVSGELKIQTHQTLDLSLLIHSRVDRRNRRRDLIAERLRLKLTAIRSLKQTNERTKHPCRQSLLFS